MIFWWKKKYVKKINKLKKKKYVCVSLYTWKKYGCFCMKMSIVIISTGEDYGWLVYFSYFHSENKLFMKDTT